MGQDGKEASEQVSGCELLESRAVMGITGGDAERAACMVEQGPYRYPVTFTGTTGLRGRPGLAIGRGNKETGNIIGTINHTANYMFIKKKREMTTIKPRDRETDIPRTVTTD